jgi:hypothetical protein
MAKTGDSRFARNATDPHGTMRTKAALSIVYSG